MKKNTLISLLFMCINLTIYTQNEVYTSFGTNGHIITEVSSYNDQATSTVIQGDGKILTCGQSYNGSDYDIVLMRYHKNGIIDSSFGTNGIVITDINGLDDKASCIKIIDNNQIVVGGHTVNTFNDDFFLASYQMNGNIDISFGTDGFVIFDFNDSTDIATSMVIDKDDNIILTGYCKNGNHNDVAILSTTKTGSIINSNSINLQKKIVGMRDNSDDQIFSIDIQSDSKFVLAGKIQLNQGYMHYKLLCRLNSDFSLDSSYADNGKLVDIEQSSGNQIKILADSSILSLGNGSDFYICLNKFKPDGEWDSSFATNGKAWFLEYSPTTMLIDQQNRIILSGNTSTATSDVFIIRLDTLGNIDLNFGENGRVYYDVEESSDKVYAGAIAADSNIILVGSSSDHHFVAKFHNSISNCAIPTRISIQPPNYLSACENADTIKIVAGATSISPIEYRWQQNSGTGWVDLSNNSNFGGTDSDTLLVLGVNSGINGYKYRVYAESYCGSDTSNIATLNITYLPEDINTPTGITELCINPPNNTYSTDFVAYAESYLWSVKPDYAGTISGTSNIVTMNWSDTYAGMATISVVAENQCGSSKKKSISVAVNEIPDITENGDTNVVEISSGGSKNISLNLESEGTSEIDWYNFYYDDSQWNSVWENENVKIDNDDLVFTNIPKNYSGELFFAVASNICGSDSSDIFKLSVDGNSTNSREYFFDEDYFKITVHPTSDYLYLNIDNFNNLNEPLNYTVFSINGAHIENNKIVNQKTRIELNSYSKGIYLIKVENKNSVLITSKFLVW